MREFRATGGRSALVLASAIGWLGASSAFATTYTWTKNSSGNASGSWNTPGNWNSGAGPVASGSGNVADFSTQDITADSTVTLDGNQTIGTLKFDDTNATNDWFLNTGTGSGKLTLGGSSGTPYVYVGPTPYPSPTTAQLGVTATINASLAGTIGLRKEGVGSLVLAGDNSGLSGSVVVHDGTLVLASSTALNSGSNVTITGNSTATPPSTPTFLPGMQLQGGINVTINNLTTSGTGRVGNGVLENVSGNNVLTANSVILTGGNGGSTYQSDSGLFTLNASGGISANTAGRTLTLQGSGDGRINGVISDGGTAGLPVLKYGNGTWTLGAANNYTGYTRVNGGTLALGVADALPSGSAIILAGGKLATGGFGNTTGTLQLLANSSLDLGNDGTLSFADSHGVSWTSSLTLSVLDWSSGNSHLFVGTTDSGLTAAQLAEIKFVDPYGAGSGNFAATQLTSGEIVPVPEPATLGLLGVAGLALLKRRRA